MPPRILAIDLRSQLFGFAVLEGPRTLLDFGRKLFRVTTTRSNVVLLRKKIDWLITLFLPSVIVLKHTSGRKDQELVRRTDAIDVIKQEAALRSVKIAVLNRSCIYRAFGQSGNVSKYRVAGLIAEMLPDVQWKLPPNRKHYEPEHHNMAIFDAISVGLAYFICREAEPKASQA